MKLKYKSLEFPVNPASIEVVSTTNCTSKSVFGKNSVVENVSVNPIIVTGEGAFYGERFEDFCAELQNALKNKGSGWLLIPSAPPIKAFFTELKFKKSSKRNFVLYSFKFTEECSDRKAEKEFSYIFADKNENAFEIAGRYNVDVNEIMRLNDFKSPFDISEGDRVVLK